MKGTFACALTICASFLNFSIDACNGNIDYCNKRYNEIFGRVRVHNAASYYDSRTWASRWQTSLLGIFSNPVADQSTSFEEQLADLKDPQIYPRVFKFPVHPVEMGSGRYVQITHTLSNREFNTYFDDYTKFLSYFPRIREWIREFIRRNILWRIDATNMSFTLMLQQLKMFLDENKNEVVTLSLNIFDLALEDMVASFKASGIDSYIHVQDKKSLWPTLRELIDANKRLVIFQDAFRVDGDLADEATRSIIKAEPWVKGFHWSDDFIFGNQWGYTKVEDLGNDSCDIIQDDYIRNQEAYQNRSNPSNKIFDLSQTVTPGMAGTKETALRANAYGFLLAHIKRCYESLGMLPNTVTVDFFDGSRDDLDLIQRICNQPVQGIFNSTPVRRHVNITSCPENLPGTCPAEFLTPIRRRVNGTSGSADGLDACPADFGYKEEL